MSAHDRSGEESTSCPHCGLAGLDSPKRLRIHVATCQKNPESIYKNRPVPLFGEHTAAIAGVLEEQAKRRSRAVRSRTWGSGEPDSRPLLTLPVTGTAIYFHEVDRSPEPPVFRLGDSLGAWVPANETETRTDRSRSYTVRSPHLDPRQAGLIVEATPEVKEVRASWSPTGGSPAWQFLYSFSGDVGSSYVSHLIWLVFHPSGRMYDIRETYDDE